MFSNSGGVVNFPFLAFMIVFVFNVCFILVTFVNKILFQNYKHVSVSNYENWYVVDNVSEESLLVYADPSSFHYLLYEKHVPNLLSCKNNLLSTFKEVNSDKFVCIPNYIDSKLFTKIAKRFDMKLDINSASKHYPDVDSIIKKILKLIGLFNKEKHFENG